MNAPVIDWGREELTCPGTGLPEHNSSVFVLVVYERSMALKTMNILSSYKLNCHGNLYK